MLVGDRLTEQGRQVFGNLPHGPGPRPGQMMSALRLRIEFLEQSHACYVGDVTRIDKVHASLASRARPGAGGDLTSRTLEDVDECRGPQDGRRHRLRSEEHTSELPSHLNLVCRLLLEKKKKILITPHHSKQTQNHATQKAKNTT